jgi:nicotinate phosphoribosyltransferase
MSNQVKISSGPNFLWYYVTFIVFLLLGLKALFIWVGANIAMAGGVYLYLRFRHTPIITSLLDSDWYKFSMGQVVFHQFPHADAVYRFYNRGKTQFPPGFADALKKELKYLSKVRLSNEELMWLDEQGVLKHDYITWLENYRFKPEQVVIEQTGGDLVIIVEGPWVETILWEVPLMAIISELYFKMTGKTWNEVDFYNNTVAKADKMCEANVKWSDFGTRRRFSYATQDLLNRIMGPYEPNFLGTSNPHFAMKYGLKPIGTYAHEAVMAMQAKYSATESNVKWMEHWWEEYKEHPHLLTALTDTLTTEVFLRTYNGDLMNKYTAVRQDSGSPIIFGMQLLEHYRKHNINPKEKKIVFSDSLDTDKACALQARFGNEIPCFMGIGTHLTNDCGHKPLNMVIKLIAINFGDGLKTVVKLSDDEGKHTGDNEKLEAVKKELGL